MTLTTTPQEDLAGAIALMNRHQVQREIMSFAGRFRLDFTPEYLQAQPVEQLRHILLAAKLLQQKKN